MWHIFHKKLHLSRQQLRGPLSLFFLPHQRAGRALFFQKGLAMSKIVSSFAASTIKEPKKQGTMKDIVT